MTYRYQVALVFLLGFFIDCVNIFMSAVALPSIATDLQVSGTAVAWVANAYLLGLTLIMPISTWLAGRYGSREILTLSMLLFSITAGLCALAGSFPELLFWRLLQGIGGGLLIPVGQALTFNLFQGEQRAKISTLIMAVALIAPALSPPLGGLIVDHSSWRWVFSSNLPFSLLAAGLAWCWIRERRAPPGPRPDLRGLLLVSTALATLLLGLSLYGTDYPPLAAASCLLAGVAFSLLYIRHCRRSTHPIVDLRLLRSVRLSGSIGIYYAIPGLFTGVNLLSMFFLQDTLHFSAGLSGSFMLLYAGGAFIAILVCGRVYQRVGARCLFGLALLLHSAGIGLLCGVDTAADLPLIIAAYGLMGVGGGIGANTAQTTALLDFDGARTHKGSVIWNINRQMSFSLGAALLLMICNLLLRTLPIHSAYHLSWAIAALLGLLPLLYLHRLHPAKQDTYEHLQH